jgi:hypothetical protein
MVSLDKALEELVKARKVKLDDALLKAHDPQKVEMASKGGAY